ncbi:TPA: hypothetical protein U3L57_000112 [Streptococcus agalactiae]|nr:hypothetical protein [Streptococcus agalactiae]
MDYQKNELKNLFTELYSKSKFIHDKLMRSNNKIDAISQIDIFELYSTYSSIKIFFAIEITLQHHELSEVLQDFVVFYNEVKDIYLENDRNTSWLDSAFRIYEEHYNTALLLFNN